MRNTDWKQRGTSTERTKYIKLQHQKKHELTENSKHPKTQKTEILKYPGP